MARFIKIGTQYLNQEHITSVACLQGDSVVINQVDGTLALRGEQAQAFTYWLDQHVAHWGADVLAAYADHVADEARKAAPEYQAQEAALNDIPF